ncbi:MAG: regulatory signaling modulator protein AmpE [Pseudomonadota bacterium]
MSLLILIAALAIEEYWASNQPKRLQRLIERYADWLAQHFNGGQPYQGLLAWGLGALLPAIGAGVIGGLLWWGLGLLGWLWAALVLYLCFGFKTARGHLNKIALALRAGELEAARDELKRWRPGSVEALGADDVARLALEEALRAGFSRLLGVAFWFVLFGPFGAVLFRLTHSLHEYWHAQIPERDQFLGHVDRLKSLLDWLPVRVIAFSFAIAGNFQGAMECWRNQAWQWRERNEGVLLAAGAGAIGVKIGGAVPLPNASLERAELGTGHEADPEYLEGAAALIWRVTLFWLAILFLLKLGELAA